MRERIPLGRLMSTPLKRVFAILILFGFFSINPLFAQPANDDCNSDTTAPTDGCVDGFIDPLTTADVGNGSCVTNGPTAANVWFSFVAQGMDYDIDIVGLNGTGEITLLQFVGAPCEFASAQEIDCGQLNIVGNDVLNVGQQYYISVTSSNGTLGAFSVCVDNPVDLPPPPNDDPCAATPIPADGSCTTGTTVNATGDWSSPNCPGAGEISVWYQVTLGASSNSLDVNLGAQTVTGDVSVLVGTFGDCTAGYLLAGEYCGPAGASFTVNGLTPGTTYWIAVTSTLVGEGIFDICVTEDGPPPACAAIDPCSGAQDISTPAGTNNCVTGCNTGTAPDPTGGAGCFDFGSIPTVWYTFTTDNNTDFINLDLNSPEFDIPQVAVFEGNCTGFALVDCNQGSGGTSTLIQVDVIVNTTYYIAVGSVGGQDGAFNLCLTSTPSGGTNCNASTSFNVTNTSLGSPPSGPFQAGEDVTICIDVTYSSASNNCQWIHGLVPEFGDCWDPISFNPDGSPVNVTLPGGATWNWYNDGDVIYNDVPGGLFGLGDPVGAGWFVTGVAPNPVPAWCAAGDHTTDPNCSWGVPQGCGTQAIYQFCVTLTTKSYPDCDNDPANIDCGISIRTFGDGETGGWVQTGCQLDVPWFSNYSLNCCEPPTMVPLPETACSDEQIDVFLDDFVIPAPNPGEISYTWTVSAPPGVTGATDCLGGCVNVLSQILVNTTNSPQIVTYTIIPRTIEGCLGFPADLTITVLPSVVPEITNLNGAVCSGACITLFGSATGGIPPYSYEWSNMETGISTEVCPTFTTTYGLTVTDGNDCTGETELVVEANPNLDVTITSIPDVTEICESDPMFPMTLTAFADIGGPGWLYNWVLPSGASPSIPFVNATQSGTYYVTLIDANGCTGEDELDIIVHPPANIVLFPVDPLCQGGTEVNLTAIQDQPGDPGTWSGPHVSIDGTFTPTTAGTHNVCYDFLSDAGCPAQECMDIIVNPIPPDPTFSSFEGQVCGDQTGITYCVDPITTADSYDWTFPAGVLITGGLGTNCISVNWNNAPSGDVCVTAVNNCGNSGIVCDPVVVESGPDAPANLSGLLNPCINQLGVNYSIDAVSGANSYTWTVTNGTFTGSGTSITVDWGSNMVGQVCVYATSDCGDGQPACIDINLLGVPGTPDQPTGPIACQGEQNVTYTISNVADATGYTWTVNGGTFTGSGTSIDVDWGNNSTGDVCVLATNDCGDGTEICLQVNLGSVPADAGPITGLDELCQNTSGELYSIIAPTGATGYTWTSSSSDIVIVSTSDNEATIDFGIFSSGQVCVTPFNDCGDGQESCITISPILVPETPTGLSNDLACAGATGLSYTATAIGATGYSWDLPAGVTMVTGQTTGTVGFNTGSLASGIYSICVTGSNNCGDGPEACFDLTIDDVPAEPITDALDDEICATDVGSSYSINDVAGADTYTWSVPSGATISSGQGNTQISVDWNGTPGGQICVYATNNCGDGVPVCFNVTADLPLAAPSITCDLNNTGLDQVGFTVTHPTATDFSYTWIINGNGVVLGPSTDIPVIIPGLNPNDEVEIFVTALAGNNSCGDSEIGSAICSANDCVNNPPSIQGDGDLFCPDGLATQMTASPAGGDWTGDGISMSGMFDPNAAGIGPHVLTYSYTDANSCPQSGTITVVVNNFPIANAGTNGNLSCAATSVQLDGTGSDQAGNFTYSWSGNGTIIDGNTLTPTVDALGTFILTVTNNDTGCSATDEVDVTPDSNSPNADAGADQTITCNDPTVVLNGSATNGSNLLYEWSGPGIDATNINEIMPTVSIDGNYTLIVTNLDNGCESSPASVDVFPTTDPVAEAGPASTYTCATNGLTLDGVGSEVGINIEYLWTGPGSITDATTLNPTVDGAGTYTIIVTDNSTGCVTTDEVIILPDNNSPTASVTPLLELTCNDPMQALTGGSSAVNTEWIWTGPNGFTSDQQNPMVSEPGQYFLAVLDLDNGCSSAAEVVDVTLAQDPTSNAGSNDVLTCANPTLQLSGSGTVDPNISYLWTGPGTITDPTSLTPTIDVAGIFTLTVTNDLTGCNATSTVEISPDANAPDADAGTDQMITCIQTSVQLSGTGLNGSNFLYTWTGPGITPVNENDQNPTVSVDGEYFLVVTNQTNGCSSAGDPVNVTLPAPILVNAGMIQTLTCAQDDLDLNATVGTTTGGPEIVYLWTGPGTIDNGNTLEPTIYTSGTFTLTVSNTVTGCAESADVIIDPDLNAPSAVAGPNVDFTCLTPSVQISVSTDATTPEYSWSGPNGFASNMASPSVFEPGTYSVVIVNLDNGCDNGASVDVIDLTAEPIAEAGATDVFACSDLTVDLNGAGSDMGPMISYSWSGPGTITNGTTLSPSVDIAGTFELTVTNDATGCFATDQVIITPDQDAPIAMVGAEERLDCNNNFELQLSGSTSSTSTTLEYMWTGPNGFTSNIPNPTVNEPGDYTLVITDTSNQCSSNAAVQSVIEATPPVANIQNGSLTLDCVVLETTMTVVGCANLGPNVIIEWLLNGQVLDNGCQIQFEAVDLQSGTVELIITDTETGCSDNATIDFINNYLLPGALAGEDGVIDCEFQEIELEGSSIQTGPTVSYQWTGPTITSDPNQATITVGGAGDYILLATESNSGCESTDTVNVEDNSIVMQASGDDQFLDCNYDDVVLEIQNAVGTDLSYQWYDSDGNLIGQNQEIITNEAGVYNVVVTDNFNSCFVETEITVFEPVDLPVDFELEINDPTCPGDANGLVNILSVSGGTQPFVYKLDDIPYSDQTFFTNLAPGTYNLTTQDAAGCELSETIVIPPADQISVDVEDEIQLSWGDSTTIVADLNIPLNEVQQIIWTPANAVECLGDPCVEVKILGDFSTRIGVTVINEDGCETEDFIDLRVIKDFGVYWPNAFSPTGEGNNDLFRPFVNNSKIEKVENFIIVDRWGEIVYSQPDFDFLNLAEGWDGKLGGKFLNPAVFVYYAKVTFIDGSTEEFAGDVTLIR